MATYLYQGPPSGVNIAGREIPLHPGAEVELPESHEFTKTLVAGKHLTPAAKPAAAKLPAKGKAAEEQSNAS